MESKLKRDLILDNYQNATNRGIPDEEGYIKVNSKNESCVDNINVAVKIEKGVITDVRFDGEACAICTSATNVLAKELKEKTLEEAENLLENYEHMINEKPYEESTLGELNIYDEVYKQPSRKKCALLPADSVKKILEEND